MERELSQAPFELWVDSDQTYVVKNVKSWFPTEPIKIREDRVYGIHICNHYSFNTPFYISDKERETFPYEWVSNINNAEKMTGVSNGLLLFDTRGYHLGRMLYVRSPDYRRPLVKFQIGPYQDKTTNPNYNVENTIISIY